MRTVEGTLIEFSKRCNKYEMEIKKMEEVKHLPGWNYRHYFVLKEGLAFTLEQFGLTVNALSTYNELKSFMVNQKGNNIRSIMYISDI